MWVRAPYLFTIGDTSHQSMTVVFKEPGRMGPSDWHWGETEDNPRAPGGRSSLQGRDAETVLGAKSQRSAPLMKIGYNIIIKAVCEWSSRTHTLGLNLTVEARESNTICRHCVCLSKSWLSTKHTRDPEKTLKVLSYVEKTCPRGRLPFCQPAPCGLFNQCFLPFLFGLLKMAV